MALTVAGGMGAWMVLDGGLREGGDGERLAEPSAEIRAAASDLTEIVDDRETEPTLAATRPCPVDDRSFCDFVYRVDELLRVRDYAGLVSLVAFKPYECTEADSLGTSYIFASGCKGNPAGTIVRVTPVGLCGSEGADLDREDYLRGAEQFDRVYGVDYPHSIILSGVGPEPTAVKLGVGQATGRWQIQGTTYVRHDYDSCIGWRGVALWPGVSRCALFGFASSRGCEAVVSNVAPDRLNLREKPGRAARVVQALTEGTTVCTLLSAEASFEDGHLWYPVRTPTDGMEGWLAAYDPLDANMRWLVPTGRECAPWPVVREYTSESVRYGDFQWMSQDICQRRSNEQIVDQMRTGGASDMAIAFFATTGFFLKSVEELGPVDVGYGTDPCLANRNTRLFFLNGEPAEMPVPSLFPSDWQQDPGYSGMPRFLDAARATLRESQMLPDGRQRALVAAPLQDCGACEPVAYLQMAVDFDNRGNILERRILPPSPP